MAITVTDSPDSAVELELQLRDRDCFFVDASASLVCRIELEHFMRRSDETLLEYFTVVGAEPDRVLTMAERSDAIEGARLVNSGVNSDLFEFVVSGRCVTTTLADRGAIARSVRAVNGVGRITVDVPPHIDVRRVVEGFRQVHSPTELVACRGSDQWVPVTSERGINASLADRLTDKQLEVLETAYLSGYFSWPRKQTAEECAEALGITQPTFSQHIRTAEEKVVGGLFTEQTSR